MAANKPAAAQRPAAQRTVRKRKAGISKSAKITIGVCCLPLVVLMFPTFIVLVTGMLPTLVATFIERNREKHLAFTVGLMNLCGTLPGVVSVWEQGQSEQAAFNVLNDVFTWFAAYAAAAVGWGIYISMTYVMSSYYTISAKAKIQALRQTQRKLVDDWGEEVAEGVESGLEALVLEEAQEAQEGGSDPVQAQPAA